MESQKIEYVIKGFGISGYDYYKDNWEVETHKKMQILTCQVTPFKTGEGVGIYLKGTRIGTMPSVLSNSRLDGRIKLKQFLTKFVGQTEIEARVTENEPRRGGSGWEVACDFYLKGEDTAEIREYFENIEEEINKIAKQRAGVSFKQIKEAATITKGPKKSRTSGYILFIKEKSGEIKTQHPNATFQERSKIQGDMWKNLDPLLQKEYKEKAERERQGQPKDETKEISPHIVVHVATDGSGERALQAKAPSNQMEKTCKRHSDESGETIQKRVNSSEQMQETGASKTTAESQMQRTRLLRSDDKIVLTEKNLCRISQKIGKNWPLFAIELGFSHVETQQFEYNNHGYMATQICNMLADWKKRNAADATLCKLQTAMEQCPMVHFQQPQMNEIFTEIRKEHQKTTK